MALMESTDIPMGSKMPEFELPDAFGEMHKSSNLYGPKGLLVVFTCNHCPYAQAIWPRLIRFETIARQRGVKVAAINPNIHPDYPEDSPEQMKHKISEWKIEFPYLVDETQNTARSFKAQCTPDIYLFNHNQELVYHGRFDDNWKDETKVKKEELKEIVDQLWQGKPISPVQHPSLGCSIKWRT